VCHAKKGILATGAVVMFLYIGLPSRIKSTLKAFVNAMHPRWRAGYSIIFIVINSTVSYNTSF
jgi:hypothetical protein